MMIRKTKLLLAVLVLVAAPRCGEGPVTQPTPALDAHRSVAAASATSANVASVLAQPTAAGVGGYRAAAAPAKPTVPVRRSKSPGAVKADTGGHSSALAAEVAATDRAEKWGQRDLRFGLEVERTNASHQGGQVNASYGGYIYYPDDGYDPGGGGSGSPCWKECQTYCVGSYPTCATCACTYHCPSGQTLVERPGYCPGSPSCQFNDLCHR